MTTKVLLPSTYSVSSSKLTVANENNMYTDTSSTTYTATTYAENSVTFTKIGDKWYNEASTAATTNGEVAAVQTVTLKEGDPESGSFTFEDCGVFTIGGNSGSKAKVSKIVFKKAE